jgi:hypothetical protein
MFEHQIFGRSIQFSVEVVLGEVEGQMRAQIYKALEDNELSLDDYELSKRDGVNVLTLKYTGPQSNQKKFLLELWSMGGIKEVKQL